MRRHQDLSKQIRKILYAKAQVVHFVFRVLWTISRNALRLPVIIGITQKATLFGTVHVLNNALCHEAKVRS